MSSNWLRERDSRKPDYFLLGVAAFLILLGLLILASVSAPFSYKVAGNTYHLFNHQLLFGLLPGLILGYLAYRIDLEAVRRWAPRLLFFNLILMAMVFLPVVGSKLEGASRWISLGPLSFQPSELLKLTFVLYLASWLTSRGERKKTAEENKRTLIAFSLISLAIALLLYLQSDISTLAVIALVGALLYFVAATPWWHSLLILLAGAGGLYTFIKLAPYRIYRLAVFLNPELDPMGIGYQAKQALIAVGSGGLAGLGLGLGVQRLGFLPQSVSDSVFAVFSEETGFLGSFFLVFLFLVFFWRSFKIAKGTEDKFCQLAALGIAFWIIIQSFVNIGAMIGLLPLTGIPLPFISYGGSALVSELLALGILLNISRTAQKS